MRRTLRLFANVKPARYLEAGNPTGLTGLYTHSSPRSSLLYLYSNTLEKLQKFPESSLYRQSVEAVTKRRMSIVEAAVPPGYKEWAERARKIIEQNPEQFHIAGGDRLEGAKVITVQTGGSLFVHRTDPRARDVRQNEWDGEPDSEATEGLRGPEERETAHTEMLYSKRSLEIPDKITWEPEPQMTADQYAITPLLLRGDVENGQLTLGTT